MRVNGVLFITLLLSLTHPFGLDLAKASQTHSTPPDFENNLIIDTDSYKASHWVQYPPGTTSTFSYLESRGGRYDRTVFFGLQYLLKKISLPNRHGENGSGG